MLPQQLSPFLLGTFHDVCVISPHGFYFNVSIFPPTVLKEHILTIVVSVSQCVKIVLKLGGNVDFKSKTTRYFTSKIGLFGNREFRTSKLWQP